MILQSEYGLEPFGHLFLRRSSCSLQHRDLALYRRLQAAIRNARKTGYVLDTAFD
jgi:hypothetical protein